MMIGSLIILSCPNQARLVSCYMISRLVLRICFRLVGSNSNCFIGNGNTEDFDLSICVC
uniref:Uncharacterized protein n=1 Tax=Populus trichocarpa TaxID=3694 RepID=A0A3N7EF25_POPTR